MDPNYSTLPAMAGGIQIQWLNPTESINAPEATLRVYDKLESGVTK